jgi:hypothetical protein
MALLVYAFSQALSGRLHGPFRRPIFRAGLGNDTEKYGKELGEWLRLGYPPAKVEQEDLLFRDLPENVRQILQESFEKNVSLLRADLEEAMRDYFGCDDLQALIHDENPAKTLSIRLNEWNSGQPFLSFQLKPGGKSAALHWAKLDMMPLRIPLSQIMREFSPMRSRKRSK